MPHRFTFLVPCVKALLDEEMRGFWVDPFGGSNSPAHLTNDADASTSAMNHGDGLEFLKLLGDNTVDGVVFDPPYSVEQALRCYKPRQGGTAGRLEYQYACIREVGRIIRPGGKAICFGWNSNGVGKKRDFELIRVLLIAHGATHNDTIITVERKLAVS